MGNKRSVMARRLGPTETKSTANRRAAAVRWARTPEPHEGSAAVEEVVRHTQLCRSIFLDEAAPRLAAKGTNLNIKDANGYKLFNGACRHPNHHKKVTTPALRERHAELLELLVVEPTAGCDVDEEVKVFESRDAMARGEPALVRVFFLKEHGKLAEQARWLGSQASRLRRAGDGGDWRLDEKTGNWYMPVGISTGAGHKSSMAQDGKGSHIRSYTFPGDVTSTVVPYTRVALDHQRAACNFTRQWWSQAAVLLSEVAMRLDKIDNKLLRELAQHLAMDDGCIGDALLWPTRAEQLAAGGEAVLPMSQWGVRLAGLQSAPTPTEVQHARWQPCALHCDTGDVDAEAMVLYLTYEWRRKRADEGGEWDMREQDLVIFEHATGGRGVRVVTAANSVLTAVMTNYSKRLHGNVLPNEELHNPVRGRQLVRLVGYNTKGIAKFIGKVRALKPRDKKACWGEIVRDYMDKGMRQSMGLHANSHEYATRARVG